jgi:hypothetical protein
LVVRRQGNAETMDIKDRPMGWTLKHGPRIWANELQLFRLLKPKQKISVKVIWDPRDLWIGAYWDRKKGVDPSLFVYICIIPCLPIRIHHKRITTAGRYL